MRIRLPDRRHPGWWRRRLPALALVWGVVAALGVVPIGIGALPQAQAASSLTVKGPKVWLPATETYGPEGSVTVSQASNLGNQVLQVSWSGFTPTVDIVRGKPVTVVPRGNTSFAYAVRVYQCRGTDPKITDCYGTAVYNADPAKGFLQPAPPPGTTAPDFPTNMVVAPTGPDGSGATSIEVWTGQQSPSLGCDATHPCSLVVEPNYGGDPLDGWAARNGQPDCNDHSSDIDYAFDTTTDGFLQYQYGWKPGMNDGFMIGEMCAWEHRAVVPLSFAPTPSDCKAAAAAFKAAGLEMANRAMQQWRTGLCLDQNPMSIQYTPAGGEPQARGDFLGGSGPDVALTARPDRSPPARPYVYAPLATTGTSVVFVVDDPTTGRQIRDLRLNARLLAKLLTQSYSAQGAKIASVEGNPTCVFQDPEFLKLNPQTAENGIHWPTSCSRFLPTVVGSITDLTYQLTSWIAADPDAARFLNGEPDPWGMHIDSFYLRPKYAGFPIDALQRQDDTGVDDPALPEYFRHMKQYEWNPVGADGLLGVVRKLLQNQPNCVNLDPNSAGAHEACPAMDRGTRTLFAIMDAGQAKAFSLPEAALLNPAGALVPPSTSGFQAALADMPVDAATGTQELPYGQAGTEFSRDAQAYPLTTVQYAMVPTAGVGQDKAAAISRFVKTVSGAGQVYGTEPGKLAPGFLGLTNAQRQQAQEAADHVEAQDGKLPGNQVAPPAPPNGGDGGTTGGTDGGTTGGTGGGTTSATDTSGTGGGTGAGTTSGGGGTGGSGTVGGLGPDGTTGAPAAGTPAAPGGKPGATPSPSGGPLAAAPVAAGTPAADRAGTARLLLPIALIAGLVLLVGGPAALFFGGTPAGAKAAAGLRSGWARLRRRH
ncbi:hypothetical protein [Kitasatospora sp. NPDC088351]|uniref:hypothetical protein n=1 Tax=Kitasatospora sp. NPDC088351 TaxID=3155180 RepID=UPI003431149A